MFSFLKPKIKVCVHSGSFHPDDIFAVAILSLYEKRPLKVIRSRDPKDWQDSDYVCDVGREYNPLKKRFDHHQSGWNEKRDNGILYAACGLVWKEYGEVICGSKEIAEHIDEKILQPIDANDNGITLYKSNFDGVGEYSYGDYLFSYNLTWKEKGTDSLAVFLQMVAEAKKCLKREIKRTKDKIESREIVEKIYQGSQDKRIIILDDEYSTQKVLEAHPEPLFVVKPVFENKSWHVGTIRLPDEQFKNRRDLPQAWAGKEGIELQKITGVLDALFCHNGRFVAGACSKEGAIALAKLALENA